MIGWLYQFYISEKKDEVFDGLKKNKKITPENIPAATQLFTPHWIVRYLVENSLGGLLLAVIFAWNLNAFSAPKCRWRKTQSRASPFGTFMNCYFPMVESFCLKFPLHLEVSAAIWVDVVEVIRRRYSNTRITSLSNYACRDQYFVLQENSKRYMLCF